MASGGGIAHLDNHRRTIAAGSHHGIRVDWRLFTRRSRSIPRIFARGLRISPASSGGQGARLAELANSGMPIVHTTRNAVLYQNRVYTSPDSQIDANNLPWQKARILLQLAMLKTAEQGLKGNARLAEIQRLFELH
jgi:hypothetical protein